MKKILAILSIAMLFAICLPAQSVTPRTGVYPYTNVDNTFASLGEHFFMIHPDIAALDSFVLSPSAYKNIYVVDSLLDSVLIAVHNITPCYTGDILEIIINNSKANTNLNLQFSNNSFACQHVVNGANTNTNLYPGSSKRAYIRFVFDGLLWVEECRSTSLY